MTNFIPRTLVAFSMILTLVLYMSVTALAAPMRDFLNDEAKPQVQTYKTVDGRDLHVYLFYPPLWKAGDKHCAVVWIHGGAWVAGDADAFFPHARYFASRGAVSCSVEYRLLTPDGKTNMADALGDVKSAMRYLRTHAGELGIDSDRIAVAGDSAGGHLAASLGTLDGFDDPKDDRNISCRPNALLLYNPIVDMTEGGWLKFTIGGAALAKRPEPAATQPSSERIEVARQFSPLFHVAPHQPPTLLMHGLNDHVVDPEQARQFAGEMKKAGNRCDLVLVEGAHHAFVLPRYTASEAIVVNAITSGDRFLVELGYLTGEPTLTESSPPAWIVKPQANRATKPVTTK